MIIGIDRLQRAPFSYTTVQVSRILKSRNSLKGLSTSRWNPAPQNPDPRDLLKTLNVMSEMAATRVDHRQRQTPAGAPFSYSTCTVQVPRILTSCVITHCRNAACKKCVVTSGYRNRIKTVTRTESTQYDSKLLKIDLDRKFLMPEGSVILSCTAVTRSICTLRRLFNAICI